MSWIEHHKSSERLASEAQIASLNGDSSQARKFYAWAAHAEQRAISELAVSKSRTFAISAVSAVSLYHKADMLEDAKRVARDYLAEGSLLDFAKEQLTDLVSDIDDRLDPVPAVAIAKRLAAEFGFFQSFLRDFIDKPVQQLVARTPQDDDTSAATVRCYFEHVDKLYDSGGNVAFSNSKGIYAVGLITRLLNRAQHEVRLFSGWLTRQDPSSEVPLYGDRCVVAAAQGFLQKDRSKFIVVLEHELDVDSGMKRAGHPLIKALVSARDEGKLSGTFELRKAANGAIRFLRERDSLKHMMVVDRQAYRIETDGKHLRAHVNFGDEQSCAVLSQLFDEYILAGSELLETV